MLLTPAARKRMLNIAIWSRVVIVAAFIVFAVLCVRSCYVAVLLGE